MGGRSIVNNHGKNACCIICTSCTVPTLARGADRTGAIAAQCCRRTALALSSHSPQVAITRWSPQFSLRACVFVYVASLVEITIVVSRCISLILQFTNISVMLVVVNVRNYGSRRRVCWFRQMKRRPKAPKRASGNKLTWLQNTEIYIKEAMYTTKLYTATTATVA